MRYQDFFYDFVMPLHPLYYQIEMKGIRIDMDRRSDLTKKYEAKQKEVSAELENLIGFKVNTNSPKQVANLLYKDLKCPVRNGVNEDTLVALLGNSIKDERRSRILNLILEDRRLRKLLGTYLYAKPDFDGRMRTSYRIVGTETGRTATGILKPPMRMEKIGWAFQTITRSGDAGSDLRSMLIPDEGMEFAEVDSSQAEARVVALLARDAMTLELFGSGLDIHKFTAGFIFGKPNIDSITKEERFIGKVARHAYNYAIKKHTLMLSINSDAKKYHIDTQVSEWRAQQIIEKLDKLMPNTKGVFHPDVERCLANDRTLVNPFGRRRTFFGRWDDTLKKEGYANIPQATVGDNTKRGMLHFKRRIPGVDILIEAHDSFLVQYPVEKRDETIAVMRESMELPIDFATCSLPRGIITIPSEVKIGPNWKDLTEVK